MDEKEIIRVLGQQVKEGKTTWAEAAKKFGEQTGNKIHKEAFRKRYERIKDNESFDVVKKVEKSEEFETHYQNGDIDIQRKIWFDEGEEKTPEVVLKKFGYSPEEWVLTEFRFGSWEVAIQSEEKNRVCTTVRAKIKPLIKEGLTIEEYMEVAKEVFANEIEKMVLPKSPKIEGLDESKAMVEPFIEMHLSKYSDSIEVGSDYNSNIAIERFKRITEDELNFQKYARCSKLYIGIGSDFINSDTTSYTTTKGTQQHNDISWKRTFLIALELYKNKLITLRDHFNEINVFLVQGNHDYMTDFYLYLALQQAFRNDEKIKFSEDYKEMECFTFGNNVCWVHHGDADKKRLLGSLPYDYPQEYSLAAFRYCFLGHLHNDKELPDKIAGIKPIQIGSPTGTDAWHYKQKYITQPLQEYFVLDKENGMINHNYINFEGKKKLIKSRW
jgi:hypothetical protein